MKCGMVDGVFQFPVQIYCDHSGPQKGVFSSYDWLPHYDTGIITITTNPTATTSVM